MAGIPAWVPIAAEVGGSILGALGLGGGQKAAQRESRDARRGQERLAYQGMAQGDRQFGYNANMGRTSVMDQRALEAADVEGRLNRSPMADQAQYLLMQRLGAAPRDITRGTAAYASAPDPRATAASYRPGMGGVDTTSLRAAHQRLADPSQVPDAYTPMSSSASRLDAERAAIVSALSSEADPMKRNQLARRLANIDSMIAAEGAGESPLDSYDPRALTPSREEKEQMVTEMLRRVVGFRGPR